MIGTEDYPLPARVFYEGEGGDGGSAGAGDGGQNVTGGGTGGTGGEGGTGGTPAFNAEDASFRGFLPEDIRGSFETVPNLEALARGYLGGQKLIGEDPANILKRPKAGDQEGLVSHMRALGAPEATSGYDLKALTPEGVKIDEAFAGSFLEKVAVPTGMLPHQVQAAIKFVTDVDAAHEKEKTGKVADQAAKWQAEIATMWNTEAQSVTWKENVALAAGVVDKFGGDAAWDAIEEAGLGDNPAILEMFRKIGTVQAGGTLEDTGSGGPASAGTRDAALAAEIAQLKTAQLKAMDDQDHFTARNISEQIQAKMQERERLNKAA